MRLNQTYLRYNSLAESFFSVDTTKISRYVLVQLFMVIIFWLRLSFSEDADIITMEVMETAVMSAQARMKLLCVSIKRITVVVSLLRGSSF